MLNKDEIDSLAKQASDSPESRLAQKALAHEVTIIVHGKDRTESVERVTSVLFGSSDLKSLNNDDIEILSDEIPTANLGESLINILVSTNTASSNNEAKRLVSSGAISVNSNKIDSDQTISVISLIKKGKNSFILVR